MTAQPILEARGLRRRYGDREVVSVDSLGVSRGEVLAILGPNGAGKSTLFRMLALLERPDAGEVVYDGHAVKAGDLAARRAVAAVFQRPVLFQGSVRRNVEYGLRLRRVGRTARRARAARALELMGIAALADADSRTLSGGEAQRVAIARALVLDPKVLFLDEPTSGLDGDVRRRFREDLRRAVRELATTVVLITHDQSEAFSLADRVAVMRDGRIVQQGPAREVLEHPRDSFVARFTGIETVWRGVVTACGEGLCELSTTAGLRVQTVTDRTLAREDEVMVAMRPEDVALSVRGGPGSPHAAAPGLQGGEWSVGGLGEPSREQMVSSVRNSWPGVVEAVVTSGPLVRVVVRVSEGEADESRLVALVTRPAAESLTLVPGRAVVAGVKATALHLLDDIGVH